MSTATKLEYLNETKSKIKDNINLTGAGLTNQTPFRQYATGLKTALLNILNNGLDTLYNNFPQTTGTGTNITLNNTLEAPIKSELLGNTSQNGTPTPDAPVEVINGTGEQVVKVVGKNLFKIPLENGSSNGITWVINENGSITLNGTSTNHTNINSQSINMPVVVGETYTISATNIPVGNIGFKELNGNDIWVLTSNTLRKTQTINNNIKTKDIMFAIYIPPNRTLDNVTITFQLEKGSTATEYETYKEQSYEINLGKNLLDLSTITSGTISQVAYTNDNGTITLNDTASGNNLITSHNSSTGILLQAGTYTLSANNSIAESNNTYIRLCTLNGTGINGTSVYLGTANNKITFTLSNNTKVRFQIRIGSGITYDNYVIKPQLEKGNQASSYSPYFTPIELCEIGNYQDRIYKDNGKWYLEKQIDKVVLDGSENWYLTQNLHYQLTYSGTSRIYLKQSGQGLSNYFEVKSTGTGVYLYPILQSGIDYLRIQNGITLWEDVATFKTWLSTHNVSVYYVLATPTIEEITDSTLLNDLNNLEDAKSYNGTTNITITAETPADIKITALKNE